jgi:hypothetical protein
MKYIVYRLLFGLLLLAAIAGIAVLAYNAGVVRGEAVNAQAPVAQNGSPVYPTYPLPLWGFFPFFGFGFFGPLVLIFLLFLAFGAARRMIWGPRFGWHGMHRRYGPWGEPGSGEEIPPMIAEMHRRMHANEADKPAGQST